MFQLMKHPAGYPVKGTRIADTFAVKPLRIPISNLVADETFVDADWGKQESQFNNKKKETFTVCDSWRNSSKYKGSVDNNTGVI